MQLLNWVLFSFTNVISSVRTFTIGEWFLTGDRHDCPASTKNDRREALSIFRELWAIGNSPLHRMYSSWDELENNLDVKSNIAEGQENYKMQACPYCGAKQRVSRPFDGVFPYLNCESCKRSLFVQSDLKVRKLTEEEKADIPASWIQVVEDLAKKKVAVVLRME